MGTHYAEARELNAAGMSTANSKNFRKLFRYISGNNELKEKIPMTVPVFCTMQKDSSGGYSDNYDMKFWLPQKYQSNPPKPTSDEVEITVEEERIAYEIFHSLFFLVLSMFFLADGFQEL